MNLINFHVVTLFPEFFENGFKRLGVVGRAIAEGIVGLNIVYLREFGVGKSRQVDDYPFGGGGGMVLKPEPIYDAVNSLNLKEKTVIVTSASGKFFTQEDAKELSKEKNLVFICGRYEGIDERIVKIFNAREYSIGKYVLSGGDLAAAVMIDAIARLKEGVVGNYKTVEEDSYSDNRLAGFPHFTRPVEFLGEKVPEILRSGNHKLIEEFRKAMALYKTVKIFGEDYLNEDEKKLLDKWESYIKQFLV